MNALIIVDVQNDFLPGGALPVPEGDAILRVINRVQRHFDSIVATQDWHPPEHGSFAANHAGKKPGEQITLAGQPQILWPVHCVQGTPGADFSDVVDRSRWARVFPKGTDAAIDSYSGFYDNGHRKATGLGDYLRERGAEAVYLAGLATDYCVKFTALDAVRLGFRTHVIQDACRGVNLQPGDVARAFDEMRAAGVQILNSTDLTILP